MEKHVVLKPFEIGKTYKTKFSVPEDFRIEEIKLNRKGEPYYFNGVYINSPHLGICPLDAGRLVPEKVIITPSEYLKYAETLPQAEQIYKLMMGEPKSHREWAESINKIGEINRIINKL